MKHASKSCPRFRMNTTKKRVRSFMRAIKGARARARANKRARARARAGARARANARARARAKP